MCLHSSLQCVAVSPCNDRVAAGDATGRILIWHGVGAAVAAAAAGDDAKQQQPQQPQQLLQQDSAAAALAPTAAVSVAVSAPPPVVTSVHWHAHGVRALAFSLDAQRLLSGGDEAVLVRAFSSCRQICTSRLHEQVICAGVLSNISSGPYCSTQGVAWSSISAVQGAALLHSCRLSILLANLCSFQVTWRLADNSRSFLAHLGAPLAAVLPADASDAAYVVARTDNALCQVTAAHEPL